MTISTTLIKRSYDGDGSQHSFQYNFKIFDANDLRVLIRAANGTENQRTLDTHYIVTGAGTSSGGNVLFKFNTGDASDAHYSATDHRPASGETVVIRSELPNTQTLDLVPNDPFPASSFETALDKLVRMVQQHEEELDRSIKLSRTNTMTSTEFTTSSTDRASKVLAFDSSGELSVTTELGTFRGNWSASTAYVLRDIVKDTSTNNIFIVNSAHTSSGAQPLTTNANSAKYSLIVDAASVATSATNAATSETNAGTSETNAAASAASALSHKNDAETAKTASETAKTAAEAAKTAAETAQTAAETALDTFDDRFLGAKSSDPTVDNDGNALIDGAIYFDTVNDLMKVYDLTNTQWRQLALTGSNQTNVNTVAGQISPTNNISTIASRDSDIGTVAARDADIGTVASNDSNISTVATNITDITTVKNSLSEITSFNDIFAVSASAPSSPSSGDLWYDTANSRLMVYVSNSFQQAGAYLQGLTSTHVFTATANQTDFTTDDSSNTMSIHANGNTLVFKNGVRLIEGSSSTNDYYIDGNTIKLNEACGAGDVILVEVFTKISTTQETSLNALVTSAQTHKNDAETAKTAAETAQTAAETAETGAETAKTGAETAKTAAETAQTAAETAKTAAETAKTAAETALDTFDDRMLGAKSSAPSVDNDGNALVTGALYWDTSDSNLYIWDGTAWQQGAFSAGSLLANMIEDTTPQLGGDLDVVTHSIVSTTNRDINITPNGTGAVVIDGLSHPTSDGTSGQFMKTDGSGNLSFGTVSTPTLSSLGLDNHDQVSVNASGDIAMGTSEINFGTNGWSVEMSGTNLVFKYNGTAKIKFASDGEIVTVDDVTAFGTI